MKKRTPFPGTPAERAQLLMPVLRAVEAGDVVAFMQALAAGGEPGLVHWKVALAIPYGVSLEHAAPSTQQAAPEMFDDMQVSIAQLCFHCNRPELLAAAAHATWPEHPGDTIRTPVDRFVTLCSREFAGEVASISLARYAATEQRPHSVPFIDLAISLGQDDWNLDMLCDSDPRAAVLVTEARMRRQISRSSVAPLAENAQPERARVPRARHRSV